MSFIERFERGTKGLQALSVGSYPHVICDRCKGTKLESADDDPCEECNGTGLTCECPDCEGNVTFYENDPLQPIDEGSFSWRECETCSSHLGGDRHRAHALMSDTPDNLQGKPLIHLDVCVDCLFYIANGDLPEEPTEEEGDE